MKRIKKLSFIVIIGITLLCVPFIGAAKAIPWSTEQYTATANSNVQYGPPLPISVSFSGSGFLSQNTSDSTITSTYMDVSAHSHNLDYTVGGTAEFMGTYIASSFAPLFQFTYDGYFTSVVPGFISEHYAWLTVTDQTASTVLYENNSLTLDNALHTINVATLSGHEISVNFGAQVTASRDFSDQFEDVRLNYSMAVAPEPISSILFVTGGTLLAGRRYLRRKKA